MFAFNPSDQLPELRLWLARRLDSHRAPAGGDITSEEAKRPAAVLVALVMHADGPSVLFTRRADHLSKHAGQVSFPGGRIEAGETPEAAAIRETGEEIGLAPEFIDPVGRLSNYSTITGFSVTPVVALVRPGFTLKIATDEVAEVFDVPVDYLLNIDNWREHVVNLPERRVVTHAIRWEHHIIWGATAGMLAMLRHSLCG